MHAVALSVAVPDALVMGLIGQWDWSMAAALAMAVYSIGFVMLALYLQVGLDSSTCTDQLLRHWELDPAFAIACLYTHHKPISHSPFLNSQYYPTIKRILLTGKCCFLMFTAVFPAGCIAGVLAITAI